MDMVTSNQLGKITNAQFEELQTQITQTKSGHHTEKEIGKTLGKIHLLLTLLNFLDHDVTAVNNYFDTNHKAVSVSMGLGGLLDVQLNSLHK
ncbi:hypothetical protein G9A89_008126 [Geosiphon pyriformis]|nr:hypothetical protein G9A89_008126 [Geosiphon pyriformis]